MKSVDELRDILETTLPAQVLLNEIEYWFGAHEMLECYKAICDSWEIELESEN